MRFLVVLTTISIVLTSAQAANLVIAPVGASITFGYKSSHGNGYRDDLTNTLIQAGHKVHMVGTRMAGDTTWRMSEGWPGFTISKVQDKFTANFQSFHIDMGTPQRPNVIVTLVGTNDNNPKQGQKSIDSASERFSTLLNTYQKYCEECVIIVSSLPPNANQEWNNNIINYNNKIKKIVNDRKRAGQHILFSDGNSGITVARNMDADGTHPNDGGYHTIGVRIAEQVEAAVKKGWTKTPTRF